MDVFVRVLIGLSLVLWVVASQAQSDTELSSWQFLQNITLSESVLQDSRLDAMFIGDLLLISHPNLDGNDGCGSVLLMLQDQNGQYRTVQTLSAADFNRDCTQPDGFGFSMDYKNQLLVIGAPEQVFIEADEFLSRGAIYVYRLNESDDMASSPRLLPLDRVAGTFLPGDVAWGTRVATDGSRILVQSNAKGDVDIAHGMAIARTVNLLEPDAKDNWGVTQQFSGDQTIFGTDFVIGDQGIIISSHEFRFFDLFNNTPVFAFYRNQVEVYSSTQSDGPFELQQTIQFSPRFGFNQDLQINIQDRELLFWRQNRLMVISSAVGFLIAPSSHVFWYLSDQSGHFEFVTSQVFYGTVDPVISDQFEDINQFATTALTERSRGILSTFVFEEQQQEPRLELNQQQTIAGSSNRRLQARDMALNSTQDRLLLIDAEGSTHRLTVYTKVAALDPAITGTWWFGPEFNGQGVTLEVLLGNRLLLHWFTYDLSGNQMWMRGVGTLKNGTVNMVLNRARGPRFPIGQFDPDDRMVEQWGTVEIRFNDCRSGQLSYQSDEFGNDSLSITPLFDNRFLCNRGFFINDQGVRAETDRIVGSLFDLSRSGEGIIFMPVANNRDVSDSLRRIRFDVLGFWLTYNTLGEQAWYYLGQYSRSACPIPFDGCRFFPLSEPRSTVGPVFGPGYNPADRVTVPWGSFGPIQGQGIVDFSNPDGSGRLTLDELTIPIGY